MENMTLSSNEDISNRITRPQVRETQSRKLEDKAKQDKFRDLCKVHSIVSDFGHRINDVIDLIGKNN